ncbi:hypothetical protein NUH87_20065 [Pseudomonas batumici]|uniref:hypothetical protein n=1 Tax=Pseudomonas batumici TaxID=226910 RepID=UPI0030D1CDF1
MDIFYSVNGDAERITLPNHYYDVCTPTNLAELVASFYWRQRPLDPPRKVSVVHLRRVDGIDMGTFEVVRSLRPVYTASPTREA